MGRRDPSAFPTKKRGDRSSRDSQGEMIPFSRFVRRKSSTICSSYGDSGYHVRGGFGMGCPFMSGILAKKGLGKMGGFDFGIKSFLNRLYSCGRESHFC